MANQKFFYKQRKIEEKEKIFKIFTKEKMINKEASFLYTVGGCFNHVAKRLCKR